GRTARGARVTPAARPRGTDGPGDRIDVSGTAVAVVGRVGPSTAPIPVGDRVRMTGLRAASGGGVRRVAATPARGTAAAEPAGARVTAREAIVGAAGSVATDQSPSVP